MLLLSQLSLVAVILITGLAYRETILQHIARSLRPVRIQDRANHRRHREP